MANTRVLNTSSPVSPLALHPRHPVERVLQERRDRGIIFGAGDEHALILAEQRLERARLLGRALLGFEVAVIDRHRIVLEVDEHRLDAVGLGDVVAERASFLLNEPSRVLPAKNKRRIELSYLFDRLGLPPSSLLPIPNMIAQRHGRSSGERRGERKAEKPEHRAEHQLIQDHHRRRHRHRTRLDQRREQIAFEELDDRIEPDHAAARGASSRRRRPAPWGSRR